MQTALEKMLPISLNFCSFSCMHLKSVCSAMLTVSFCKFLEDLSGVCPKRLVVNKLNLSYTGIMLIQYIYDDGCCFLHGDRGEGLHKLYVMESVLTLECFMSLWQE